MKGDWIQAKFYINPTQWTTQAHSVAPLRYSRLNQVLILFFFSSIFTDVEKSSLYVTNQAK